MSENLMNPEIKAYVDTLSSKQQVQFIADLIDYVWQNIKPEELNWDGFYKELELMGVKINPSPPIDSASGIIMGAGGAQATVQQKGKDDV
jgi:hypothetical protein